MSTQGTIKRYTLIIQKILSNSYPSFEVLKDYVMDQGFEISKRTLQRDFEQIRMEFGIEINYNRKNRGYEICGEVNFSANSLVKFLEILNTAELFSENLKLGNELFDFITFETHGNLKGIENLRLLIQAIRNSKIIAFNHVNYDTGKIKKYLLRPYLLKEYQNRWYVIGMVDDSDTIRTFGIDRIEELIVKSDGFRPQKQTNINYLFKDVIGLFYTDIETEEVIIQVSPIQLKYLKALPLHASQEIILENKKEAQIRLMIKPNFEFKQKLLMMMDRAFVVKPHWLAKELKSDLKNMLNNY